MDADAFARLLEVEGHHPDTTPLGRSVLNQAADEHLFEVLDAIAVEAMTDPPGEKP